MGGQENRDTGRTRVSEEAEWQMRRGRVRDASGRCVHITHRCHNREFLLKFRRDRRDYVQRLQRASERFGVAVLDYVVTSDHVHVLVWVPRGDVLSAAVQYARRADLHRVREPGACRHESVRGRQGGRTDPRHPGMAKPESQQ